MKKIFFLITTLFLLVGCVESMALLGPASSLIGGGNVVQSSVSSAVNLGIKKTTGKTPMQHALAYAEEKNPNKEKKRCISFIEKTNSEACSIVKKQAALAKAKIKKKTKSIFKNVPSVSVSSRGAAFAEARKKGKDYFLFNNKIYNTKFKEEAAEKIDKPINLSFVKKKNQNKNLIKSKKSVMELALEVQTALNKRN
jgi:hypothetical protein